MAKANGSDQKEKRNLDDGDKTKMGASQLSRMKRLFGFELADVSSWGRFVNLMNEPRDPSALALVRILYAILMLIDIPQERGMSRIDVRFGNPNHCHFPLFNILQPLPVDWMYVVYLVMLIGALGILLGAFYRVSCVLLIIPYWYIFFLDKTAWNNHTYLYGLLSFQLFFLDANRFWSIDGLRNPKLRNAHIPLWNYALIRIQIFFVYFLAGIKKIDADWLFGYSMGRLSAHWVFDPFKLIMADKYVDLLIVHIGGFLLDLTVGFFLFFDRTRPYAFVFCGSFHAMNSQIFSIGMFPYAMIATMPVFCYADWPNSLLSRLPTSLSSKLAATPDVQQRSDHCVYAKQETPKEVKPKGATAKAAEAESRDQRVPERHHYLATCFFTLYIAVQLFLPFSHFVTKGYNSWTQGLYGYSWDMMVHNWHTQHVKVHFVDQKTGKTGYLAPEFFVPFSSRWIGHGDMIKQFGTCVSRRLKSHGYEEPALYVDIWKSMNGRFSQRMWDPRVDIVTAPWSPFEDISWNLPLLTELSDWRSRVDALEEELEKDEMEVTFVADFPGLYLENFVSEDFTNTTLEVLKGEVIVELLDKIKNVTLKEGEKMQVPAGKFHNVYTISTTPSCYMYTFVNETAVMLEQNVDKFLDEHFKGRNLSVGTNDKLLPDDVQLNMSDPMVSKMVAYLERANKKIKKKNTPVLKKLREFASTKAYLFKHTFQMTAQALGHILLGMNSVIEPIPLPEQDQTPVDQPSHPDDEL
ncbi:vitamin K-dependent gamma-carboxylase-like [Acanthaster planci]|uniref:Vitamin K-dependent gamma-carboxylase n=1 Tax=Acanthaster planci TaxID=133434 RepID=A0A8B7XMG8_ACAPL|nr:vitamin K-dependent gamma-carboxylase-like [Acanthaster planci]XP_022081286.1 vitamin K-dependent gamma-carboxylase-like [Acanthaster planci]XP_022081295.1 vitamin K-dependent gamma-carboxylase-like [Acanthaster planci]XP_022081303.1 vitamin K-dependent gamma-carboxylase-like [Acanthaster planci]